MMMKHALSELSLWTFLSAALGVLFVSITGAIGKDFDGMWSVRIVADDANCPTHDFPVQVSDGTVAFSGFGATATGAISPAGAVKFSLSFNQQVLSVVGTVRRHSGKGRWSSAPEGCKGEWSAQIPE